MKTMKMRMKMRMMNMTTKLNIIGSSYEDNMFHFILEEKCEIPSTIEYSKHSERHFVFYNCVVVEISENRYFDFSTKKEKKNYKYKVSYEKKFTSKFKSETYSKFYSYTRDKKLDMILL